MTVTTKCTLTVSLRELRQAVTAVVPHAEPTKSGDEISKLSRIRLTAGTGELLVMAACSTRSPQSRRSCSGAWPRRPAPRR